MPELVLDDLRYEGMNASATARAVEEEIAEECGSILIPFGGEGGD
jgi:hypothetical protein